MGMRKVSLTLDEQLLAQAKKRGRSTGLSAYVNEALRLRLQRDRVGEFLDELDQVYGPVSPQVKEEVDKEWRRLAGGKRRSRPG